MRFLVLVSSLVFASGAGAREPQGPLPISKARAQLLSQGWSPLETFGTDADGVRWSLQGDAGSMYRHGFIEVEMCSGTGLNFCSFNYVRGGKCVSLQTQGEFKAGAYEPHVVRRTTTCPDPGDLHPPPKVKP